MSAAWWDEHEARMRWYRACHRLHEAACTVRGARRLACDPAIVAECERAVIEWRAERRAAWRAWRALAAAPEAA